MNSRKMGFEVLFGPSGAVIISRIGIKVQSIITAAEYEQSNT